MTDPSRLKRAQSIFERLAGAPADRRAAALSQECEGDGELAAFVTKLLLHDDSGMSGFLAAGAVVLPANQNSELLQIGNFRLLRRISEGGMGVVFEAEQANPRRTVALKVIRGGRFVDEHSIRLFQRETQALARLRHPCVGAIFEAGRTDEGQHYFAMEFVQGRPLTEFVRERQTGLRERLELFCKVCDAIHYAHQRGVMHRDLKPTNILVDDEGHPKILDFGLARLADENLGVFTSETVTGRIQGTLAYMSPEQARGNPDEIDTRSDVYSLGIILYELTTDALPYEVQNLLLPRAIEIICNQPPRKTAGLHGDLETITHKALEKEPPARYASAAALGEDLRRYLANQPIEARRHSGLYVLRKALARYRVAASVAFAFVALVSVSAVALGFMYRQQVRAREAEAEQRRLAQQETRRAIEEHKKTETFAEFMEQILQGVGPTVSRGRDTQMLKEMMDAAAKRIDEGELKGVPAAEFRLRDAIGEVYLDIGEHEASDRMTGPMIDLARQAFGEQSVEYAKALDSHAAWLHAQGKFEPGMTEAETALSIYRRLFPGDHELTLAALNRIGSFFVSTGRPAEAFKRHQEALAMARRLYKGDEYNVAISLSKSGDCMQHLGKWSDALPLHQEALAMFRRLSTGDNPDVPIGLNRVAADVMMLGRPAEGLPLYEEALAMRKRLFPGDHPRIVESECDLARCLISLARPADALPHLEAGFAMVRRLFPGDHSQVGTGLNLLGNCLVDLGRPTEAMPKFDESLAMFRRLFSNAHPQLLWTLNKHAQCLAELDRDEEALPEFQESLAMQRRLFPGDHPNTALGSFLVASSLNALNRAADALPLCDEGLEMSRRITSGDHSRTAFGLLQRARAMQLLGRHDEALPVFEESVAMYSRLFTQDQPQVADAKLNFAACLQAAGRFDEALRQCEEGCAIYGRLFSPTHRGLRSAEVRKGAILVEMKRFADAKALLVPVWEDIAERPDVSKRHKRLCLETLVKLYDAGAPAVRPEDHGKQAAQYRALLATGAY